MFFLCKVEKILQGSHIILHYKHYQREKISGDACWTVACPWMLVSPPLAMKPRFKGNCSEQWLWHCDLRTKLFTFQFQSVSNWTISVIMINEQFYKNMSLRFSQYFEQLKLCFINLHRYSWVRTAPVGTFIAVFSKTNWNIFMSFQKCLNHIKNFFLPKAH